MSTTNAERQHRWRAKRDALAREGLKTRNWPLDLLIADREERGTITAQQRRLAVQRLIEGADPEEDAALLAWVDRWRQSGGLRDALPDGQQAAPGASLAR